MTTTADKPNRRWLRVSLRKFLVLLTVGLALLGWFANRVHQQRRAVQWVNKLGGYVLYDYTSKNRKPPVPKWLRDLVGIDCFATVVRVDLYGPQFSDAALGALGDATQLTKLTRLEHLGLTNTQVSDLTSLAKLTNLRRLDIENTPVSNEDVEMFQSSLPSVSITLRRQDAHQSRNSEQ